MASRITGSIVIAVIAAILASSTQLAQAQNLASLVFPEQKTIAVRDPAELPAAPIPMIPPPPTVAEWGTELEPRLMPLDEAIRIALANSTCGAGAGRRDGRLQRQHDLRYGGYQYADRPGACAL